MSLDENVIKHIVFSTFRNIHIKLGDTYGEHLLLCDSRSWRKDAFEYYKAKRNDGKAESPFDWDLIFRMMDEIREAFDKYFPFTVVKKKGCEADDLIASFALCLDEPVVIVSKDHDFYQLHKHNVKQFDYSKKKMIEIQDPADARIRHIIGGDVGDGVPNVLSDDDTFVVPGKRQKQMRKERVVECLEWAKNDFKDAPKELKRNWDRNKMLVDLTEPVPAAVEAFEEYKVQDKKEVTIQDTMKFLAEHKMVVLMSKVNDFYIGQQKKEDGPLSKFF